jgi:hypothetical protein
MIIFNSRRRLTEHISHIVEMSKAYQFLAWEPKGKAVFGKRKHRWENNIKTDIGNTVGSYEHYIEQPVSRKTRNFMSRWVANSFPRRTQVHCSSLSMMNGETQQGKSTSPYLIPDSFFEVLTTKPHSAVSLSMVLPDRWRDSTLECTMKVLLHVKLLRFAQKRA